MITDNYCDEYLKKQMILLHELMSKTIPAYNTIREENGKLVISCNGLFEKTFRNVEDAVRYLKKNIKVNL